MSEPHNLTILGIESSCDETAVAVYTTKDGMRSNVLFSQTAIHAPYGGVVPEIASRSHLEKINGILQLALDKAQVSLEDIDVVGITNKPGLPGSLLVGLCFGKALAWAKNKRLIGVDHLEGHAFSAHIEHTIPFPHLCITASGGHTAMYLVHGFGNYTVIGHTTDDAAGEAFDKIAKLINLPYPGGPVIEKLATEQQFQDFFKYPRSNTKTLNFSFSGLKTAVLYDLVKRNAYDLQNKQFLAKDDEKLKQMVASSLLVCIRDIFEKKLALALENYPEARAISFVGGVACNKYLRQTLGEFAAKRGLNFFTPSPQYCTDNAGMIAFVAHYKAQQGLYSDWDLDILR